MGKSLLGWMGRGLLQAVNNDREASLGVVRDKGMINFLATGDYR